MHITFRNQGFKRLLPVIPPNAEIDERSSLFKRVGGKGDARGKIPGIKEDGKWHSFRWTDASEPDDQTLQDWSDMGAGVGIRTGKGLIVIDADTLNPEKAKTIQFAVHTFIGDCPVRIGNAPKAAYLCRVDESEGAFPYSHIDFSPDEETGHPTERVEILQEGRFFVADGIHPKTGRPYYWPKGLPEYDKLPVTSVANVIGMLDALKQPMGAERVIQACGAVVPVSQDTLAGDIESVSRAVKALPNTSAAFPSREDYLDVGYAIKAALPHNETEAFALFREWCNRWDDGTNAPEVVESDWNRMKPPFRRGAGWLYNQCQQHGVSAGVWFNDLREDTNTGRLATPGVKRKPVPVLSMRDILDGGVPQSEYLVKGLLDAGAFSVLYGPSNVGKTFLALDIAAHVPCGQAYCGMKVKAGAVVYLAAEGSRGVKKRLIAMNRKLPGLADSDNFFLLPTSLDLCHEEGAAALVDTLDAMPHPPALLVVDTLSRAMAGEDENSSTGMGAIVRNLDAIRRRFPGLHIMAVHHTGKDATKGARGHSLLRAAVDTEIEVVEGSVSVTKQRELETTWTSGFTLDTVKLGVDSDGDDITTCVVRFVLPGERQEVTATERMAQEALVFGADENGISRVSDAILCLNGKLSDKSVRKAVFGLAKKQIITSQGRGKWRVNPYLIPTGTTCSEITQNSDEGSWEDTS